ncbi:MAG: hypothetical protein IJW41_01905 [Oscillospiraceae bacterium]|nr:hypothetical protein [Oscillospiraceae bacterium]
MVEYDFYVNSYLGSAIPEKAFPGMAKRAQDTLERYERLYKVVSSGEDARSMAICAMAEALYEAQRRQGLRSANVGSVTVHYEDGSAKSLNRELYQRACIYLDIYRGVGQ